MQEKSKDKDVDGYGKRLLKQAELFKKFALPNTDDEYTSDSENEYDHHPEEEFLAEGESEFNAQDAWNNACENYASDDEDNQQVPYQSQDRGREVVHPPPKARSYRPKEPKYARPPPISPYLGGMDYWHRIQEWEKNQQYGYQNEQEWKNSIMRSLW